MPYHAIPCYAMLYHVTPCHTMLYHITPCHTMPRQRRIETHQPQGRNYRITALSALPLFAHNWWQIHRNASDKSEFLLSVDNVSLAICPTNPTRQFRWSVICYLHGLHLSREKSLSTNTNKNIYTNTNTSYVLSMVFTCQALVVNGETLVSNERRRHQPWFDWKEDNIIKHL